MREENPVFLGRGAGFNTAEGNTSAYLRGGDELLLIDCGETVFSRLMDWHILEGINSLRVVISHLHSDHCGSLGNLSLFWYFVMKKQLELVVPSEPQFQTDLTALLRMYGVPQRAWCIVPESNFGSFAGIEGLRFIPTRHVPDMLSFSLEWIEKNGSVFYSADTCESGPLERFMEEYPNFHRIYMDTTDIDSPEPIHLPLSALAQIVPAADRDRVCLMHLNRKSCAEKGKSLGFRIVGVPYE